MNTRRMPSTARCIALAGLVSLAFTIFGCAKAARTGGSSSFVPSDLHCEYRTAPIDVDAATPRLGWVIRSSERGWRQTAYRILAAKSPAALKVGRGDLWDSGRVASNASIHVPYGGAPLVSGMRIYWKVKVWDANGRESGWSAPASWEMGLLSPSDWKAEWIGFDSEAAPLFRREFTLKKDIAAARAYICGLGYYELHLNGAKVGDHVLDPGQTDYTERVFYVTYDVTGLLKSGPNAAGVMLGDGWYNQRAVNERKYGWGDVVYGDPRFIFQLRVDYADGSSDLIVSDGNWKASPGPILLNNVYAGESYDARREQPGWDAPGFVDGGWARAKQMEAPGGVLESQKIPPVKRMAVFKTKAIVNPKPDVYVFDMGQNFAGWARLRVTAPSGTVISMRFAESVNPDGTINMESTGVGAIHVEQTDRYTCRGGGVETWEPRFTYHGFRYVEMTGYPGTPTPDMLEGIAVYTAMDRAGSFACSDPMLNKIQDAVFWTFVSNYHSVPTDCPAREKCGWLGDAHIAAETGIANFDMPVFWAKYVRDIETSRRTRDGIVEDIAPGRRQEPGIHPDWGSAFIQIPWYMYLYYGDTAVMREHYDGMREFLAFVGSLADGYIVSSGYGDWCPPGQARPKETPVAFTSTALYYFDAVLMARMADLLGKTDDASDYRALAEHIRKAFLSRFYDYSKKTFGSQTANSLALYLGLAPAGDEDAVAAAIADDVVRVNGGHLTTGVTGSRHLYHALSGHGYGDTALGIFHKTDYPSIGHLFSLGATTLWESWTDNGSSKNHPMQGSFGVWFYDGIGGINPDPNEPGYKHTILRPLVVGGLDHADVSRRTPYGTVSSNWTFRDGVFTWRVSIPANTTATVCVPADGADAVTENGLSLGKAEGLMVKGFEKGYLSVEAGSGTYTFVSRVDAAKWATSRGRK